MAFRSSYVIAGEVGRFHWYCSMRSSLLPTRASHQARIEAAIRKRVADDASHAVDSLRNAIPELLAAGD